MAAKKFETKNGKIPVVQFFSNRGRAAVKNPDMPDSQLCILQRPDGTTVRQWVRSANIVEVKEKENEQVH